MIFRISSVRISDEYLFLRIKTFLTTTHLKKMLLHMTLHNAMFCALLYCFNIVETKLSRCLTTEDINTDRNHSLFVVNLTHNTCRTFPNRTKVATITKAQLQEIAETKMPDLNAASLDAAISMIAGTARSMGVTVED